MKPEPHKLKSVVVNKTHTSTPSRGKERKSSAFCYAVLELGNLMFSKQNRNRHKTFR